MAAATAGFRWNTDKVRYEPVLRFTTATGHARHKVLDPSFDLNRLPADDAPAVVYDPHDADFAELSYDRARTLRPPTTAIIAALVTLFTSLPVVAYLHVMAPLIIAAAIGLGLGVLASVITLNFSRSPH